MNRLHTTYDNLCILTCTCQIQCTYRACSKHNTKPVHVISMKKEKSYTHIYTKCLCKLGYCTFQLMLCELRITNVTKTTTQGPWSGL